jgi:hypothetical protein
VRRLVGGLSTVWLDTTTSNEQSTDMFESFLRSQFRKEGDPPGFLAPMSKRQKIAYSLLALFIAALFLFGDPLAVIVVRYLKMH